MVRYAKTIILKELKELIRDPRILLGVILVPLLIFPIMGSSFFVISEVAQRETMAIRVSLVDEDRSVYSRLLFEMLNNHPSIVLVDLNHTHWVEDAISKNVRAIIRIPQGLASNLSIGLPGTVELYVVARTISPSETGTYNVINYVLSGFSQAISTTIIDSHAPTLNALTVLRPIVVDSKTIFKGEVIDVAPESFISATMSQTMMVPVIIMILMMLAAQVAVTSIAVEKEEKTLETLLTLPVKRVTVLWGKLIGSAIVAAIGVVAYMVGFSYYMNSITSMVTSQQAPALSNLYVEISLEGYALIAVSLFLSLMSTLALAVLLGSYTQDVRSAHSLLGVLFVPIFIPTFILMFTDVSALPLSLQLILYAIPFSHPMIAAKSVIFGDYLTPILGILYNVVFMLVVLQVAAKFFSSEKVVTARIVLSRRKGAQRIRV
ncbi:MAG: ABC transporter permease [Candidatus Nezhaarchaeales archaeon]